MAKFLTPDENTRLANYWKRQAYEYTMKAHSGDQGVSVENIRINTMNEVLQMLGYDVKFGTDYSEMFQIGNTLHNQGYRRKGDRLVKENTTVEDII